MQKISPSQICNLLLIRCGHEQLCNQSKMEIENNKSQSESTKFFQSMVDTGMQSNKMSMNSASSKQFWQIVEMDLSFKSWLKYLENKFKPSYGKEYAEFEREILKYLHRLLQMTNLHKFIIETIFKLRDLPIEPDERKKKMYRGNVLNLYGRSILIQLEKMQFEDMVKLNKTFNDYINHQSKGEDLNLLIDKNVFFIIQDDLKSFYESNKNSEPDYFFQRVNRLKINDNLKESLINNYQQENWKFMKCLQLAHQNDDSENIENFEKNLHFFIDSKIFEYFPSNIQQNSQQDLIQQAVLLKAFLNLFRNNLEEAEICFNDSIRFAQINKDEQTINTGLSFLVLIYTIQQNFEKKYKTLKDFHQLNINNKNPLLVFYNTLYYLDMDIQFDAFNFNGLSETKKNQSLQMNQIENIHFSLKKIGKYLQDNFFNRATKYFCSKTNLEYYKQIMHLKFLNIFSEYRQNLDFILVTDQDVTQQCRTFYTQSSMFEQLLLLIDEDINQFLNLAYKMHKSYFNLNSNYVEYYFTFILGKLFLRFGDCTSSLIFYQKAKRISIDFQDPLYKHHLDLWYFNILFEQKNYKELQDQLLKKLNELREIGYSKILYYKFFMVNIKMLYELKNYQQILKEIRDHQNKVQRFNLFETYYFFTIYQQKCEFQLGQIQTSNSLLKQNKLILIRASNQLKTEFYYELILSQVKSLSNLKEESNYQQIYDNLQKLKSYCQITLNIKMLKKTLFLETILYNKMNNEVKKQSCAKAILQFDYLTNYIKELSQTLQISKEIHQDGIWLIQQMQILMNDIVDTNQFHIQYKIQQKIYY